MNPVSPTNKPSKSACHSEECRCVVCGCESVGKTQLLASLTGKRPISENFRGSTVTCKTYRDGHLAWTDTPGIAQESESSATRTTMEQIHAADRVMLVARADRAAKQLPALLPAAAGKPGFIALTFLDRISTEAVLQIEKLSVSLGVSIFPIDARHLTPNESAAIRNAAAIPAMNLGRFPTSPPNEIPFFSSVTTQVKTSAEQILTNPFIALFLLFLPAITSIIYTNRFADWLSTPLARILEPALTVVASWPSLLAALFGGNYGLVSMFPFLLLYAAPTIAVFSAILTIYKSTGLIDHLSHALHPWLRPVGIGGRDLVRVIMGFGCNVPAIVSSRACYSCSRGACISAISFGSACSYQLPATLAVFAAAGMPGMGFVYLATLALTTLIYLRFTTPKALRSSTSTLFSQPSDSLTPPSWHLVWREMIDSLKQFIVMAFPIFIVICFAAALLDWSGALGALSQALAPVMALFNLPSEAASAIVLGSIRKDGIAIGLLDSAGGNFKVALSTSAQVLTAVYLAGVLLPCLVTVLTIIREMRWKFAAQLCARQILWAVGFSICIAWGGELIF